MKTLKLILILALFVAGCETPQPNRDKLIRQRAAMLMMMYKKAQAARAIYPEDALAVFRGNNFRNRIEEVKK